MYESMLYNKSPNIEESNQLIDNISKKHVEFVPRKVNKPLILYGKGNLGRMAKEYFETINISIANITDKEDVQNIPIEQRKSFLLSLCVVTSPLSEIISLLKEQGWNDIVPFYDISQSYIDRHPLNNGWYIKLTEEDTENIKLVLSKLEDNISIAHYLQFIVWHTLREEWIFNDAPITTNNRYFIPEIVNILHNNEEFIDIGAHHGEIALKFIGIVENKYKKIYAFEPDIRNFQYIFKELNTLHKNKISLLGRALGSTSEERPFCSNLGYMSQLSRFGKIKIIVDKLDEHEFIPTFIKIHTEGSEHEIIEGSLQTITKNRPILAITIYHNQDGLWKIPLFLINNLDKYAFYFRLHSWCGTGAVIYAIPRERRKYQY